MLKGHLVVRKAGGGIVTEERRGGARGRCQGVTTSAVQFGCG